MTQLFIACEASNDAYKYETNTRNENFLALIFLKP